MRIVGEVAVCIIGVVGGSGVVKAGGIFGQGGGATAVLGGQGGRTVRFITEAVFKGDGAATVGAQVNVGVVGYAAVGIDF